MSVQKIPLQKSLFDLDSFQDVTLTREFEFAPVGSVDEALARLGNKADRLLEIVNAGLIAEQRLEEYRNASATWFVMDEDENGKLKATDKAFTGTLADQKAVNSLVLTLAKTVFGFDKNMTLEQKNAARASAMEMIKNTPAIKDGLRKSAALKGDEAPAESEASA